MDRCLKNKLREDAVGGVVERCTGIDRVKPVMQVGQGGCALCGGGGINSVVGHTAERIKSRCAAADVARQKPGRGVEAQRAAPQQSGAGGGLRAMRLHAVPLLAAASKS